MNNRTIIYVALGCLITWRFYRRLRRNFGQQKLQPRRIIVSLVLLSAFSLLIIGLGIQVPRILLAFGGGLLCGSILGLIGLRLTKFNTTAEGHFYTPDTRIGVALTLLLVGRIIYRLVLWHDMAQSPGQPPPMQSPLTFFIIGLLFGYYFVYRIGLFIHSRDRGKPENVLVGKEHT